MNLLIKIADGVQAFGGAHPVWLGVIVGVPFSLVFWGAVYSLWGD